ncbi:TIGR03862 family flavoprotein [Dinoroseobacter sp. S124A]|uniref:TIGR03862 family flavoprotein n=1 Tax=Dinoroseobacter sp. S124A TaxID=3415128 RepID=UPI003C7DA65E
MSRPDALVIGAGPAGLMAADVLSAAGKQVLVVDRMPSPGRKFLMAGKSGLNLTKVEPPEAFAAAYGPAHAWLAPMLAAFGPDAVQDWARGLGQEVFTGSTGRVFPNAMKASPLLRAWLARLQAQGVILRTRWRWTGWAKDEGVFFETPDGPQQVAAQAVILALGGASWRRLGSDGAWVDWIGAPCAPFAPANVGIARRWSDHMPGHFGTPLKGIAMQAGALRSRGEVVLSARGIEGGGIYTLSPALRAGAPLVLDLCPDLTAEDLARRLARVPRKASISARLRKGAGLTPVKIALVQECARPLPTSPEALAAQLKAVTVAHDGARPLDEAISVAGGLQAQALDAQLMLRDRPGVFACGEMLDWEAPTGGYLLTGCFATGRWAGQGALRWLDQAACEVR